MRPTPAPTRPVAPPGALRAGAVLAGAVLAAAALLAPATAGAAPAHPGMPGSPGHDGHETHQSRESQEGEARVRDLEFQVRDLSFTWRALDDSERVEETPEETTVTLAADVLFEYDRADLTPAAQDRLAGVADELADAGPRTVAIDGHTDNHGDPAYNQDLSERRAEAVRAWLADRLGGDFTFEVAGHGETRPVAPNEHEDGSDNPEGRALNRRVEIRYPHA
jgi:OOP family OmpA-OmpF porin